MSISDHSSSLGAEPLPYISDASEASYDHRLLEYAYQSCQKEEHLHFLQFEFLHRLNIATLQNRLAILKNKLRVDGQVDEVQEELSKTLREHVQAIRDYSYVREKVALPQDNRLGRLIMLKEHFPEIASLPAQPFDSHYAYAHYVPQKLDNVRSFLIRHLPLRASYSAEEKATRAGEFISGAPAQYVSKTVDRLARFWVAFVGGLFLLVPMMIMVFRPTLAKNVVTTSVAVILFSLAMSSFMHASNVETMVSVATYTAVLVVFVGASSNVAVGASNNGMNL